MSDVGVVDVLAPDSFEALEQEAPWNGRYLIKDLAPTVRPPETLSGRRAFVEPLLKFRDDAIARRTSTFKEQFPSEAFFGHWHDYTAANTPPDYSPPATIIVIHEDSGRGVSFVGGLNRRHLRLLHQGETASVDEAVVALFERGMARVRRLGRHIPDAEGSYSVLSETSGLDGASIADLTKSMRDAIDLPVQDVARMIGVGRRHFYNLMKGETKKLDTEKESRLRRLVQALRELSDGLGNPELVRAAVLTPLPDGTTFFDAASGGEPEQIEQAIVAVREKISEQQLAYGALPPSGALPPDFDGWEQAVELLGMRGTVSREQEDGSE